MSTEPPVATGQLDPIRGESAEALLWQVLSLSRSILSEMDDIEIELGDGATRPMIEPLNLLDQHIFWALFAFVPGMYDEDEDRAMERDGYFNERFGDLSRRLSLVGTPAERFHQLLHEIRRRIGAATVRLDTTDGAEGEYEAVAQLEIALDAATAIRTVLERITQRAE